MQEVSSSSAAGGLFVVDVFVNKTALPPVMPYVINDVYNGTLYENLLNTTMFLEDWARLSSTANVSNSEFAMPAVAAVKQCFKDYNMEFLLNTSSTPPNAMIIFHMGEGLERLAHIYGVTEEQDQFVLRVVPVQDDNATIVPEGQCHGYQDMNAPHFHHISSCLELDASWVLDQQVLNNGSGMTVFFKLGPAVDTGLVALAADAAVDAGTGAAVDAGTGAAVDAGTDAGADAASDAGADAASDAGADAASDAGADILSDGGSEDGDADGRETEIDTGGVRPGIHADLPGVPEDDVVTTVHGLVVGAGVTAAVGATGSAIEEAKYTPPPSPPQQ